MQMKNERLAEIIEKVKPKYKVGNVTRVLKNRCVPGVAGDFYWQCIDDIGSPFVWELTKEDAYAATVNALLDRMADGYCLLKFNGGWCIAKDMDDTGQVSSHPSDKLEALFAAFEQRPDLFTN